MKTPIIQIADTEIEIAACWEAMYLLRPMLKEDEFIERIKNQQNEGYSLLYFSENDQVVAVLGYRFFFDVVLWQNALH